LVYIQTTLTIEEGTKTPNKVPIFIFNDKQEAKLLAELFVKVKPTYFINISNSVEALRNYCKSRITKEVVFIMNNETFELIESDKSLFNKIKLVDILNIKGFDNYEHE